MSKHEALYYFSNGLLVILHINKLNVWISLGNHSHNDSPVDGCGFLPLCRDNSQPHLVYTLHISTEVKQSSNLPMVSLQRFNCKYGNWKSMFTQITSRVHPCPFYSRYIYCILWKTERVFLTYFLDGVWFSAGEYGTGYLHIGTNASLLWLWSLLFFSLVSNLLWVRDNLLWVTDTENMLSVQPRQHQLQFCAPVRPQMLFVRCRSTRVLSPCKMPRWTPICMTTSTWSYSEPRGTSTYLASLSFSGC